MTLWLREFIRFIWWMWNSASVAFNIALTICVKLIFIKSIYNCLIFSLYSGVTHTSTYNSHDAISAVHLIFKPLKWQKNVNYSASILQYFSIVSAAFAASKQHSTFFTSDKRTWPMQRVLIYIRAAARTWHFIQPLANIKSQRIHDRSWINLRWIHFVALSEMQ